MRDSKTGLFGNTLDVDTRVWTRLDASVGAGIDSMYEYLIKVGAYAFPCPQVCVHMSASVYMRVGWLCHARYCNGLMHDCVGNAACAAQSCC